MSRFLDSIKSPHIQIALATGSCIIILALFSKRVLPEPIGYLPLAFPPFVATIYEGIIGKYKDSKICTTWYWVVSIFAATAMVILYHMFKFDII